MSGPKNKTRTTHLPGKEQDGERTSYCGNYKTKDPEDAKLCESRIRVDCRWCLGRWQSGKGPK